MSKQQEHTPTPWVRNTQLNQIKGPDPKLHAVASAVYCEQDGRLIIASTAAFDPAAARLGLNAVEFAERMRDGGIADLVDALKIARAEIDAWRNGTNTRTGLNDHGQAKVGACFGGIPAISGALRGLR